MMNALTGAWISAVLLAMVGAIFGACFARLVWAEDLRRAQELQKIWDQTKSSMSETIEIQRQTIARLRPTNFTHFNP